LELTVADEERLLRRDEVMARVGVKNYSTIWRWMRRGEFPEPLRLTVVQPRVAWRESDIRNWVNSRQQGLGNPLPASAYVGRHKKAPPKKTILPLRGRVKKPLPLRGKAKEEHNGR
jgi:predicted DNA-binding transcriptional regulator AlpA